MESAAKQAKEPGQGGRMKAELGGVVVLDFGGQYTQLIARRIREQQVFSAVLPCTTSLEEIRKLEPAGIVLSGGPSSVYDADAPKCDPKVLAEGIPVLGHLLRNAVDRPRVGRESSASGQAGIWPRAIQYRRFERERLLRSLHGHSGFAARLEQPRRSCPRTSRRDFVPSGARKMPSPRWKIPSARFMPSSFIPK